MRVIGTFVLISYITSSFPNGGTIPFSPFLGSSRVDRLD